MLFSWLVGWLRGKSAEKSNGGEGGRRAEAEERFLQCLVVGAVVWHASLSSLSSLSVDDVITNSSAYDLLTLGARPERAARSRGERGRCARKTLLVDFMAQDAQWPGRSLARSSVRRTAGARCTIRQQADYVDGGGGGQERVRKRERERPLWSSSKFEIMCLITHNACSLAKYMCGYNQSACRVKIDFKGNRHSHTPCLSCITYLLWSFLYDPQLTDARRARAAVHSFFANVTMAFQRHSGRPPRRTLTCGRGRTDGRTKTARMRYEDLRIND